MLTESQIFGLYTGQRILSVDNSIWELQTDMISDSIKAGCKLILRTYEDMTEEEIKMFYKLHDDIHCGYDAQHTEYLISIGIDVFDAIGKGWAVRREMRNDTRI